MKIIDKQKDFYDFLVGKYGEDKEIVFDRRNKFPLRPKIFEPNFTEIIKSSYYYKKIKEEDVLFHCTLAIGDEIIHIFTGKEVIFTHFDAKIIEHRKKNINPFGPQKYLSFKDKEYYIHSGLVGFITSQEIGIFTQERKYFFPEENLQEIPILFKQITKFDFKEKEEEIFINPNLTELGIFLDPDFVWQNIYNFLLKIKTEKETYHEAKNDEKIYNKGFDLKTSFRPKMKKYSK